MTEVEVSRRAKVAIARMLAVPVTRLHDNAEFRRDLGCDSLDLIAVPAALEEEFGVILSDDEVEFTQTVGTAVDLIRTKLENKGGGR